MLYESNMTTIKNHHNQITSMNQTAQVDNLLNQKL